MSREPHTHHQLPHPERTSGASAGDSGRTGRDADSGRDRGTAPVRGPEHDEAVARKVYGHWQHNGHQLGDAINRAGIDYGTLPQFARDTLTDTFLTWEAAERAAQAG